MLPAQVGRQRRDDQGGEDGTPPDQPSPRRDRGRGGLVAVERGRRVLSDHGGLVAVDDGAPVLLSDRAAQVRGHHVRYPQRLDPGVLSPYAAGAGDDLAPAGDDAEDVPGVRLLGG